MSIGKRFWNLARSELNALLDRAAQLDDDDDESPRYQTDPDGLEAFSELELEEELQRRKHMRDAASQTQQAPPRPRQNEHAHSTSAASSRVGSDEVRRAYAALEVPPGSDLDTVKRAYRRLMRKYHPDRHAGAADRQKTAHDLAQRLTRSYEVLKKHLRPR